ncbi:hypothetical protein MKX01_026886, partial [Papaver californicum]
MLWIKTKPPINTQTNQKLQITKLELKLKWVISLSIQRTKGAWPELVGKPGAQAKKIIERESHGVKAIIIWKDQIHTEDFCCNRVWVPVNHDSQKTVAFTPKIG